MAKAMRMEATRTEEVRANNRKVEKRAVETKPQVKSQSVEVKKQPGHFNFGLVGVGNGGCQIAAKGFDEKNFDAILINTAKSDLATITSDIPKFPIGYGGGSGKDRKVAIQNLASEFNKLVNKPEVEQFIRNNDFIVVINTTGGGSGSGMGPTLIVGLMKKAKELNILDKKRFINVYVMPNGDEGYKALKNTMEFGKQLKDTLPEVPFMSYDNSAFKDYTSTQDLFDKVNSRIIEDLCVIRGDYLEPTSLESLDIEDLRRVLSCKGRIIVFRKDNISVRDNRKSISDMLEDSYRYSAITRIDFNKLKGDYMSVISNLSASIGSTFDVKDPMPNFINPKRFKDKFPHVSIVGEDEKNSAYVIISGAPMPKSKFEDIKDMVLEFERDDFDEDDEEELDEMFEVATAKKAEKPKKNQATDDSFESMDDFFASLLSN